MRPLCCLIMLIAGTRALGQETGPLVSQAERTAAVRLTRMRGLQLWWNEDNRLIGVAFKGSGATDESLALTSQLPMLEVLVIEPANGTRVTDQGIAPIAQLSRLRLLSIKGSAISDAGVALGGLQALETLSISGNVTDAALDTIAQLPKLTVLGLGQTRITDAGLPTLATVDTLRCLILNGTQVTSQGLAALSGMTQLESLYLSNTAVDDAAVEHLRQLKNLDLLVLLDTSISKEAVQAMLPAFDAGCEVIHNTGTYRGAREEVPDFAYTAARP